MYFASSMYVYALKRAKLLLRRSREHWMIYRGPGFLAVVWFASSPSLQLAWPATHRKTEKERQLADGRGGEGGGGAKSYESEEALSSINHSIFSEDSCLKLSKRFLHCFSCKSVTYTVIQNMYWTYCIRTVQCSLYASLHNFSGSRYHMEVLEYSSWWQEEKIPLSTMRR